MQTTERKLAHRTLNHECWIQDEKIWEVVGCHIREISVQGAKLTCLEASKISHQFVLLLTMDGRVARKCILVDRSNSTIELQFLEKVTAPPREIVGLDG